MGHLGDSLSKQQASHHPEDSRVSAREEGLQSRYRPLAPASKAGLAAHDG